MIPQKAAIIGGGICGLYLAQKLSQQGNRVTVFEKNQKIGKKACSGLFSERILELIPESRKLVENEINSVLIHFPKRTIKIDFSRKFLLMSHYKLDNLAADLAKKAGAEIILDYDVNFLPKGYGIIIGCDGPNSFVRRTLGLKNPDFRLAIQGFVQEKDSSDYVETWPVENGFIWKIPRVKETEYGIIADPKQAKSLLNKFLIENKIKLEKEESGLVPQGFVIPFHPSITLCGDAAGLTKPWSGGGVVWGLLAAQTLLKNFPNTLKYRKELKSFFVPRIMLSKIAVKVAYFLGFKAPWILPQNIKIEGDFLI
ncbi:MAG: FAD-dependent oxidoreductase [Parcubacteria group bacterium]|nr:MAG: FAD-dependent oxidoreductase [Parcubacteria group bacterium]